MHKLFMKKPIRFARKRVAALLAALIMLLSMNGCMGLYLASEVLDPEGTWGETPDLAAQEQALQDMAEMYGLGETAPEVPQMSLFDGTESDVKFSEMVYERPDTAAIDAAVEALNAALDDPAADTDTLMALFREMLDAYKTVSDAASLAYVLYSMDVTQDYYQDENEKLTVALNDDDVYMTEAAIRLIEDPRTADAVKAFCGEDFIRVTRIGQELNSPEIQPYIAKEQELIGEYDTLITTFAYEENGKTYTIDDVTAIADTDYEEYTRLWTAYYAELNRQAGGIFLELVELRDTISDTLGYESYTDYMYRSFFRDYTPEDAKRLHSAVKEYISPLFLDAVIAQYSLGGSAAIDTLDLEEDAFIAALSGQLSGTMPEAAEALAFMLENERYTSNVSDVKMESAYTTTLGAYDSPFIFMEWAGDFWSTTTLIHELGHFTRFCIEMSDGWNQVDPLDILEVDSQGLELMTVHAYDALFGEEIAPAATREHLANSLYAMITGCMEDEFQQAVYADPDMTLEEMNAVYASLAAEYGLKDLYGYTGTEWVQIPHTFQSPLYYISYATSVIPALELYVMADMNRDLAQATYRSLVLRPLYSEFRGTLTEVGLSDPFEEKTIRALSLALQKEFQY